MSKIKNGGLDQYGAEPFEQQQFGTAGVEGVKDNGDGERSEDRDGHIDGLANYRHIVLLNVYAICDKSIAILTACLDQNSTSHRYSTTLISTFCPLTKTPPPNHVRDICAA